MNDPAFFAFKNILYLKCDEMHVFTTNTCDIRHIQAIKSMKNDLKYKIRHKKALF